MVVIGVTLYKVKVVMLEWFFKVVVPGGSGD